MSPQSSNLPPDHADDTHKKDSRPEAQPGAGGDGGSNEKNTTIAHSVAPSDPAQPPAGNVPAQAPEPLTPVELSPEPTMSLEVRLPEAVDVKTTARVKLNHPTASMNLEPRSPNFFQRIFGRRRSRGGTSPAGGDPQAGVSAHTMPQFAATFVESGKESLNTLATATGVLLQAEAERLASRLTEPERQRVLREQAGRILATLRLLSNEAGKHEALHASWWSRPKLYEVILRAQIVHRTLTSIQKAGPGYRALAKTTIPSAAPPMRSTGSLIVPFATTKAALRMTKHQCADVKKLVDQQVKALDQAINGPATRQQMVAHYCLSALDFATAYSSRFGKLIEALMVLHELDGKPDDYIVCPSCQWLQLKTKGKFCTNCSKSLDGMVKCKQGHLMPFTDKFCAACGSPPEQ